MHAGARGMWFDRRKAWRAITFFRTLKHVEGKWAGNYIHLEPWQEFIVGSIFGWLRADGTRRFRDAYIEVARKNGKSTLLAGILILLTFYDGEGGAQGYSAATKHEQAKIIFDVASAMIRKCPAYKRQLKIREGVISDPETVSRLLPLGADAHTLDGLNPHVVCIDELHAHPTPAVVNVMATAQGARAQPIIVKITTAGWNRNSVCWRQHEYSRRVLDPKSDVKDDGLFAFVATLDEGDDYKDERVWVKANPGLGVSVDREMLRRDVVKATAVPEELPDLLQKRFDVWVSNSISRAIDMTLWDSPACAAPFTAASLKGRHCFGGLDLARVGDLSSFVLVFPPIAEEELWKALCWHFIPDADIELRSRRDQVPYATWKAQGKIIATPGDQTDLDEVGRVILEQVKPFKVREIAYDQTFAQDIAQRLAAARYVVVPHHQNYQAMTLPCSETLRLVRGREIQHGGDAVLRWAADNLVLRSGPSKRLLPDKERSRDKIDPMVALIMAVGRAAIALPAPKPGKIRMLDM